MCRLSRGGSVGSAEITDMSPAAAAAADQGARGMDLAAKMMQKMGWKTGLGLGRNKQVQPCGLDVYMCCSGNVAHVVGFESMCNLVLA